MKQIIAIGAFLFLVPAAVWAQDTYHPPHGLGYIFYGGATHQMDQTAGFGGEAFFYKGLGAGFEIATAGYTTSSHGNPNWIGVGSADLCYHLFLKKAPGHLAPFVKGGFADFFGQDTDETRNQAHGSNVGAGVDLLSAKHFGLRFDVRHYSHGDHILWPSFPGLAQFSFTAIRFGMTFR